MSKSRNQTTQVNPETATQVNPETVSEDNLSEQQTAILDTAPSGDTEAVSENAPSGDTEGMPQADKDQPVVETAPSGDTKAVSETGETVPDLAELRRRADLEEDNPEHLSMDNLEQMVRDNEITAEQFAVVLGVEYEEHEPEPETPAIGHNQPPSEIDLVAEDLKETLTKWKPTVSQSDAREQLVEALGDVTEHHSKAETSLRSKLAISIANYFYFNTEGLSKEGNKLLHVTRNMYQDILKNIGELIPKEDFTNTVQATIGSAIETAILIMAGKARVGYFVLPKDRKAVREQDNAFAEYPSESLKEGDRVVTGVCIPSNLFAPRIPFTPPGGSLSWIANTSEALVLLPSYVSKAHYSALWDKEGELRPDPLRQGRLTSFVSGKDVAAEQKRAADKAAKDAADAAAREAAAKAPPAPATSETGASTETETRDTAGVPTAAGTQQVSDQMLRQMINSNETISKDQMAQLRQGIARIMHERDTLGHEKAQMLAANAGSIINYPHALLSAIRQHGPNFPEPASIGVLDDATELFKRAIKPRSDKELPVNLVKAGVRLLRAIREIFTDTDDDKVIQSNADNQPVKTYDGLDIAA